MDDLIDLIYNSHDRAEILSAFIAENITDEIAAAQHRHDRRRAEGTLAPVWFDPTFDAEMAVCTAHRNIARWGRVTRDTWLLAQIAVIYSAHPLWNDEWFEGVGDEHPPL